MSSNSRQPPHRGARVRGVREAPGDEGTFPRGGVVPAARHEARVARRRVAGASGDDRIRSLHRVIITADDDAVRLLRPVTESSNSPPPPPA